MALALVAGAGLAAAGSVFKGVQGYIQGKEQEDILNASAKKTEAESTAAANRIRARSRRLAATQRAKFAASGVDLTDSALDIQVDSAMQHEVDALQALHSGSIQAANLRAQGKSAAKSGFMGLISAGLAGGGTILGGIGQYNALQQNPGFGNSFTGDINVGQAGGLA